MPEQIAIEPDIEALVMPENLRVGLMISELEERCRSIGCETDYFNFAFGQSPFQPPVALVSALARHADKAHYSSAHGIRELREAVAAFHERRFDVPVDPDRILVGAGTKDLLYTIFAAVQGEVIVPCPAWIGYAPQIRMLGKRLHRLELDRACGYRLTAGELDRFLSENVRGQHLLILNNPHNPTGVVYSEDELKAIVEVCRRWGTLVIADEIYALTTYQIERFVSLGKLYPEGAFVTNGLSKDRSAGGYRLGVCVLPETAGDGLRKAFVKIAATVHTNVSTPTQFAAAEAYRPSEEMDRYFAKTRELHRLLGAFTSREVNKIDGLRATSPEGGFYCFVDFNALAPALRRRGVQTSNALGESLLACPFHIASITGDAVMIGPDDFGARLAFVDYDGDRALDRWLRQPPAEVEEEAFLRTYAPRVVRGVEVLARYVAWLRSEAPRDPSNRALHTTAV